LSDSLNYNQPANQQGDNANQLKGLDPGKIDLLDKGPSHEPLTRLPVTQSRLEANHKKT
jgi:hypothetical protein